MLKKITQKLTRTCKLFYNFSDMKVKVDDQNYLVFNPQIGGRIIELHLAGKLIINGQHS